MNDINSHMVYSQFNNESDLYRQSKLSFNWSNPTDTEQLRTSSDAPIATVEGLYNKLPSHVKRI